AASTSEGIAIGFNSQSGNGISIGKNTTTDISASCVTLGHQSSCAGLGGTSVGWSSSAGGNSSVAVGISSSATQANTIALGGSASATANGALLLDFLPHLLVKILYQLEPAQQTALPTAA